MFSIKNYILNHYIIQRPFLTDLNLGAIRINGVNFLRGLKIVVSFKSD